MQTLFIHCRHKGKKLERIKKTVLAKFIVLWSGYQYVFKCFQTNADTIHILTTRLIKKKKLEKKILHNPSVMTSFKFLKSTWDWHCYISVVNLFYTCFDLLPLGQLSAVLRVPKITIQPCFLHHSTVITPPSGQSLLSGRFFKVLKIRNKGKCTYIKRPISIQRSLILFSKVTT